MSHDPRKANFEGLSPLVDDAVLASTSRPARKPPKERASVTLARLAGRLRNDADMKWVRRVGAIALALAVLAGGVFGVLALIPRPIPNIAQDPMDDVMGYVLLTDDFNNLPIDQRLAIVKDLIERVRTMSGEDSAMLAMFAATIEREMRRQMEENIKRLAVDVMDKYAKDYESVPAESAGAFLDDKIVEFTRMMEEISGESGRLPESPEERLAALRSQAKRDQDFARENAPTQMNQERVGNLIGFLRKDADQVAGPEQRGRVTKFMRDVTRHLRGQDVSTGKPLRNAPSSGGG